MQNFSEEERENSKNVDFENLSKDQVRRIYKMVSSSGSQCFFIRQDVASPIVNKIEFSALNKTEKSIDGVMIKDICWKLNMSRIGKIFMIKI